MGGPFGGALAQQFIGGFAVDGVGAGAATAW